MPLNNHQTQSHDDILLTRAEAMRMLEAKAQEVGKEVEGEAARWERELRKVDPTLRLVWIDENVDLEPEMREHVVPGRYHIEKPIPGEAPEFMALVGPNGEARVPGSWLLDGGPESLQAADMWNPSVHRHKKEVREKIAQARERTRNLIAEQRRDEIALTVKAAKRVRSNAGMEKTFEAKREGKGIKKP